MINCNLSKIKALVFDVDGVLSTNQILIVDGEPLRNANIKDGYALQQAAKTHLKLAIITGGKNENIRKRYVQLGITDIFMGVSEKLPVFEDWLIANHLQYEEVLYMGDDIPDLEIMKKCGCPCAPIDAATEIKVIARYISPQRGGEACVRDVVEQVLKAQNLWINNKL